MGAKTNDTHKVLATHALFGADVIFLSCLSGEPTGSVFFFRSPQLGILWSLRRPDATFPSRRSEKHSGVIFQDLVLVKSMEDAILFVIFKCVP